MERALSAHPGVQEASVSCVTHLAHVVFDASALPSSGALLEVVEDVGFDATILEESSAASSGADGALAQCVRWTCELKIGGMTCTACSGTVERHLQSLKGVERATVSLVLNKAFVQFDPALQSAEKLQEEVEDVGFDSSVLAAGPADAAGTGSRALLHLQVQRLSTGGATAARGPARGGAGGYEDRVRALPGVAGCRPSRGNTCRVSYDPTKIGARKLLYRLQDELAPDFSVEWVNVGAENEQLECLVTEMNSLRRSLLLAIPPALFIFTLSSVLPAVGIDPSSFWPLSQRVHHSVDVFTLMILMVCTPVQFYVGRRFHRAAYKALKRKSPNMDVLVSVATNTSYFYSAGLISFCMIAPESPSAHDLTLATGHFFTMGPILIAVVLLGKFLESRAKLSAMKALTDLPASMPSTAVLCSNGSDGEQTVPVELVELDDVLRVFAGGKIPVDGTVCSETAVHVDESLLTGESLPVLKEQGDLVVGGSTCISGGCLMRVTRVGGDTMLGQMVTLVQEAQASKADVQRMADKIARIFVPSVVAISFGTFLVWGVLIFSGVIDLPEGGHHGGSMQHMHVAHEMAAGHESRSVQDSLKLLFAMKFGMAVLMIACPCAMGLATPMAVMVATGVAAKRGCLVKRVAAFETAARIDVVVLDKTGTVTRGSPTIQGAALSAEGMLRLLDRWRNLRQRATSAEPQAATKMLPPTVRIIGDAHGEARELEACFWFLLETLESASDHPVAKCILEQVAALPGLPATAPPRDFEHLSGRGVRCAVDALGGIDARVGNLRFYEEAASGEESSAARELRTWAAVSQEQGQTVVLMHSGGQLLGAVALSDQVREDAEWVVDYLQRQLGLEVWLCTGDNTATAQFIAKAVGITNVIAEALPATKSDCVRQLQLCKAGTSGARRVLFVGDGINDAIALAQADVGMAIGVGATIAVEAADVTLVRSELIDCVFFLALSKSTFLTIIMNFFWAFCFNFVCLPLAAGVFYPHIHIPPLVAGIGMASSSCLVVMTSLSLRGFAPPSPSGNKSLLRPPSAAAGVGSGRAKRRSRSAASLEQEPLTQAREPSPCFNDLSLHAEVVGKLYDQV